MDTPEFTIYVTLQLQINIKGKQIKISGTTTIPRALLRPVGFSGAVSLPEDIVFVGTGAKKESPWLTNINVKLVMGDHVNVNSHGLTGRLTGALNITKSPEHIYMASGQLGIAKGVFSTHGHTLIIEPDSNIHYTKTPISNPSLNIRAARKIKLPPTSSPTMPRVIIAGVDIRGTLRHPNVSLYSVPSNLSQADILSYLLFGHPSNANTPNNITLLLQAIDSLKIGGGKSTPGGIADRIEQGLGLNEFGLQSEAALDALGSPIDKDQRAFVIGRYISPRIYVRYSRGLAIPINIVQVRYLLGTHWAIQSDSSSLGNGADIIYTIQKN